MILQRSVTFSGPVDGLTEEREVRVEAELVHGVNAAQVVQHEVYQRASHRRGPVVPQVIPALTEQGRTVR